ncbi:MAG TPA: hypothetical protein VF763_06275 [Candidatus Limnocylindrales bacterium]
MVPPVATSVVQLRFIQPVAVDPGRAASAFSAVGDWLGAPAEPPAGTADIRRFLTDLSLPVRERAPLMVFRKAAFVDLGPVLPRDGGFELAVGWRSATLAPLFPVFAGRLVVLPDELRLEGFYAPPGGEVGLVLDRAFLNIAARGTARWFLSHVTAALVARAGAEARGRPITDDDAGRDAETAHEASIAEKEAGRRSA